MLAVDDTDAHAWFHLAIAMKRGESLEEARAAIDRCVELDPSDSQYWSLRADIAENQGDLAEAVASIGRAVQFKEHDADLRFEKARLQLEASVDDWPKSLAAAVEAALTNGTIPDKQAARWSRIAARQPSHNWTTIVPAVATAFIGGQAASALGTAIVAAIPLLRDSDSIRQWTTAWREGAAGDDAFSVSLGILDAATEWTADRDQAHVLRLPTEQRPVLESLLASWMRRHRTTDQPDAGIETSPP
jgi:tetratricopeptide (TPR) repeat protein